MAGKPGGLRIRCPHVDRQPLVGWRERASAAVAAARTRSHRARRSHGSSGTGAANRKGPTGGSAIGDSAETCRRPPRTSTAHASSGRLDVGHDVNTPPQHELHRALSAEVRSRLRRHPQPAWRACTSTGVSGVEHREIDIVRGERLDGDVDIPVHGFTVSDLGTVLEQPPGRGCERVISCGNGIGELDVVAPGSAPPAPTPGRCTGVITTSGASSVIVSAILARSFGRVADVAVGEIPETARRPTPTMAADRRCSPSRSGPASSGGMPSITPPRRRHASA